MGKFVETIKFQDEIEISFMRKFFLLTTNDDCKQRTNR